MHSIRHSLRPNKLLNHSNPKPVHSALRRAASSIAAATSAPAVELTMSAIVELNSFCPASSSGGSRGIGRGSNQLDDRSKKHWSDQ